LKDKKYLFYLSYQTEALKIAETAPVQPFICPPQEALWDFKLAD